MDAFHIVIHHRRKNSRKKTGHDTRKSTIWLGYLDSNQGITVSETAVLPLDYTPIARMDYTLFQPKSQLKSKLFIINFMMDDFHGTVDLFHGDQKSKIMGKGQIRKGKRDIGPLS